MLDCSRSRQSIFVTALAATAIFVASFGAHAATCLIVGVSDGDTLKARCGVAGDYRQVSIRLSEIDAPEKKQPFGQKSKEALSELCYMASAEVTPITLDRYKRLVAKVECRGKDASTEQLRLGMAWAFTRYLRGQNMARIEAVARESRVGLWADHAPTAPWDWRARRKQERARR